MEPQLRSDARRLARGRYQLPVWLQVPDLSQPEAAPVDEQAPGAGATIAPLGPSSFAPSSLVPPPSFAPGATPEAFGQAPAWWQNAFQNPAPALSQSQGLSQPQAISQPTPMSPSPGPIQPPVDDPSGPRNVPAMWYASAAMAPADATAALVRGDQQQVMTPLATEPVAAAQIQAPMATPAAAAISGGALPSAAPTIAQAAPVANPQPAAHASSVPGHDGAHVTARGSAALPTRDPATTMRQIAALLGVGLAAMFLTIVIMRSSRNHVNPADRVAPLWQAPVAAPDTAHGQTEVQALSSPATNLGKASPKRGAIASPIVNMPSPVGEPLVSPDSAAAVGPMGDAQAWPTGGNGPNGQAAAAANLPAQVTASPGAGGGAPAYVAQRIGPSAAPQVELEGTITHPDLRGDHDAYGPRLH